VLKKEEKKNQLKRQNRKKKINHPKKVCILALKTGGNWTLILKNLSQLIGTCFWCDSSAKSLLRE